MERTTPRIQVHQANEPPSELLDLGTLKEQRADATREDDNLTDTASPSSSTTTPHLTGHNKLAGHDTSTGGQLNSPTTDHLRHDSFVKSSIPGERDRSDQALPYPRLSLDTTSGAEDDPENGFPTRLRRSSSILDRSEGAIVQSPADGSTQGGAEPPDDLGDDAPLSADTSFDSNESFYEEARKLERPYTTSLGGLAPQWDDGPPPVPTEVVTDGGEQLELELRQGKTSNLDTKSRQRQYNIEESLASLASLPPEDYQDDLQTKIHGVFHETRRNLKGVKENFFPRKMLCTLINPTTVAQELKQELSTELNPDEIEEYAQQICSETDVLRRGKPKIKSFRKIFALLVIVEATKHILKFLKEDVSDLDLPLTFIKRGRLVGFCRRDAVGQDALTPLEWLRRPKWTITKLENFNNYQWQLIAPFFSQNNSGDVNHYKLDDHHILPFIPLEDMAEDDTEREGGFGRVSLVDIHPDHHNFQADKHSGRGFAVKGQMYEEHRDAFKKESIILKNFSGGRRHPNIVSLLATYEQFNKFHLIFYRAEGDLFTYWKELRSCPSFNRRNVLWMVEQCRGIAHGLLTLHKLLTHPKPQSSKEGAPVQESSAKSVQASSQPLKMKGVAFSSHVQERVRTDSWERPASPILTDRQSRSTNEAPPVSSHDHETEDESHPKKYGRHGDINPGNILWFQDGLGDDEYLSGTLKLADFGQAELNSLMTKTHTRTVANTPTYRPPECDLKHKTIRQSYDIWCLGCVFLEFVAWMLGGKKLVEKFAVKRLSPDIFQMNNKSDTFFQVESHPWTQSLEVMVKKSVTDFMDELHRHPKCSDSLHEFLNMIQYEMLVVESNERKSCEGIWKCLEDMYQKCVIDEDYAASSHPWDIKRESMPQTVGIEKLKVSKEIEQNIRKVLALRPRHHGKSAWRKTTGRVERRTAQ